MTKRPTTKAASAWLIAALLPALAGCSLQPAPTSTAPSATASKLPDQDISRAESQWIEIESQFPDAVKPSVSVIHSETPTSWPRAISECMANAGYAGTSADAKGGVLSPYVAHDDQEHFQLALYVCLTEYPLAP